MLRKMVVVVAATVLVFGQTAWAGSYYVNYGASGGGTNWGDAYGSIQNALDAVNTAGDTSATIKVGLTTGGNYYGASSKTFSYASGTSATIDILGGYDPSTDTVTGVSNVGGSGAGLQLMVSGGATGSPNVIDFTVRDFDIKTDNRAIYQSSSTNNNNYVNFDVYDSTLSTTSTSVNVIYTQSNGGQHASVLLDNTSVSTPAGSVMSAYRGRASNASKVGTTEIRNGSTITAQADGTGAGKQGAIESEGNQLVVTGSTTSISNTGTGWGAYAGRTAYGPYGHNITDATITSTGGAGAGGVMLIGDDFSPGGIASKIDNATITTRSGQYGVRLHGWHGSGSDGGAADIAISDSTVAASGTGGIALYVSPYNGGRIDVAVQGSALHGAEQAIYLAGGGGNRGNDTMDISRSTLTAGAADGSTNSSSDVVEILSYRRMTMKVDRTLVSNGAGGISLGPLGSDSNILTLVNTAITDQDGYGVKLDVPGNGTERLTATNSTFSNLDGPAVVFGDTSGSTIEAILKYVAFVMGDETETIFENLDADTVMKLTGDCNAFYEYQTFFANTGGGGINNLLTNSDDQPAGDAMLDSDGYHLTSDSPLMDVYTLQAGDPTGDIDWQLGDTRPFGLTGLADVGADEYAISPIPEPAGLALLGLALLGLRRRRS